MPENGKDILKEFVQDRPPGLVEKQLEATPVRRKRTLLFLSLFFAALIGFTVLTFYANMSDYFPLDVTLTLAIQELDQSWMHTIMVLISIPGNGQTGFFVVGGAVIVLLILGLRFEALAVGFVAAFSGIVNTLIKEWIQRPRPTDDLVNVVRELFSFSFPSGHVMFYLSFFGFLWFLAFTLLRPSWLRKCLLTMLGMLIVFVGPSRVYLGTHWPSDVLGAYLLGGALLLGAVWLYEWGKERTEDDERGGEN